MLTFPGCKINLGLHIVDKREDGYHNLETIFYPIALSDILEIVAFADLRIIISGNKIAGDQQSNLCVKAYHLIKQDHPEIPFIDIFLHKVIPIGAGLGGGSSDGAAMLILLNEKFQLNISPGQLKEYALQLGSDCSFFLFASPAFATSKGEILTKINLSLVSYQIVLVDPKIHIDTSWAFSQIHPTNPGVSILNIIQQPVNEWRDKLVNDFEQPVIKSHPNLNIIKETLYENGALYAAMTGSGSVFYGIFKNIPVHLRQAFPSSYDLIFI